MRKNSSWPESQLAESLVGPQTSPLLLSEPSVLPLNVKPVEASSRPMT